MGAGNVAAIWILAAVASVGFALVRAWLPFAVTAVAVIAFIATAGYALNHWEDYSTSHIANVFDWIDASLVALAVCSLVVGVVGLIVRRFRNRRPDGVVA